VRVHQLLGTIALSVISALPATAQEFNWRANDGQSINLMLNNHPWSQAMRDLVAEFTAKTGIKTQIEIFNEEQFRARLTTLMQGKSPDLDVYMSLTSREGAIFEKAGWYSEISTTRISARRSVTRARSATGSLHCRLIRKARFSTGARMSSKNVRSPSRRRSRT